jgi:hypothetical protein
MAMFRQSAVIMHADPNRHLELIRMKLRLLLAVGLVYGSPAGAQDVPNPHARFFNDSAKAVSFFVDGQFGCSVPANPEGNDAYCDAEIGTGKHTLSVRGPKLSGQSCGIFVRENTHGEGNLSKAERLYCRTVVGKDPF